MQYFVRFPQVLPKQTMGEVWNYTVIWWLVVSGIFLPTPIAIGSLFFKLWCKKNFSVFSMPRSVHLINLLQHRVKCESRLQSITHNSIHHMEWRKTD